MNSLVRIDHHSSLVEVEDLLSVSFFAIDSQKLVIIYFFLAKRNNLVFCWLTLKLCWLHAHHLSNNRFVISMRHISTYVNFPTTPKTLHCSMVTCNKGTNMKNEEIFFFQSQVVCSLKHLNGFFDISYFFLLKKSLINHFFKRI